MPEHKYLDPNKNLNDYTFCPYYTGNKHFSEDLKGLSKEEECGLREEWFRANQKRLEKNRIEKVLSNSFLSRWPFKLYP